MDRTSWVAVIICVTLLFWTFNWNQKESKRIADQKRAENAAKQVEVDKNEPEKSADQAAASDKLLADAPAVASKPAAKSAPER